MDDRTLLRIDALLKHINQIFDDTANIGIDELKSSNLLLRAVLSNFIKNDLFSRQGKAVTNFAAAFLPEGASDLAQQLTRNPHDFNFLTLDTKYP